MFGIKRMHQQRDRLYLRTQLLEKRAKQSREKAVDNLLDKATSPAGLLASFVLGATTQLDISRKARKNLLNGASRDILSFLMSQVSTYMAASAEQKTACKESMTPEDEETPSESEDDFTHTVSPTDDVKAL